jgi:hypothetical protein
MFGILQIKGDCAKLADFGVASLVTQLKTTTQTVTWPGIFFFINTAIVFTIKSIENIVSSDSLLTAT